MAPVKYPPPPAEGGVTETIHGVTIKDPWRVLERPDAGATRAFIAAQNEPILSSHPRRAALEQCVAHALQRATATCPERQPDGWYYWLFNNGSLPRDVVVRSRDIARDWGRAPQGMDGAGSGAIGVHSANSTHSVGTGAGANGSGAARCFSHGAETAAAGPAATPGPELVFDPAAEEHISLYWYSWSPDGRYWIAILQEAGSDWQRIRTLDTHNGFAPVDADLTGSKFTFGGCWIGSQGFLYKKQVAAGDGGADGRYGLFFHALGTEQPEDVLVWTGSGPDAACFFVNHPQVCAADPTLRAGSPAWLVCDVYRSTSQEAESLVVALPADLGRADLGAELARRIAQCRWICRGWDGTFRYVGTLASGTHLFQATTGGRGTGCIVAVQEADLLAAAPGALVPSREVVPPHPEGLPLGSARLVAGRVLVLMYLRHACSHVVYLDAEAGAELPVDAGDGALPEHTSVSAVVGRSDSPEFFLSVESFVDAPFVLRGEVVGDTVRCTRLVPPGMPAASARERLITRQVFYLSHDNTRIPMFLCHAEGLDASAPRPLFLTGYGGFQVPASPHYTPAFAAFARELRGIVAIPCIRGGGEYGKAWHAAAQGTKRVVGWEDFACAARHLHAVRVSTPAQTVIYGTSNGGLLCAASVNLHPELFCAACVDVGVLDLVRFHKFTMGRLWVSEYGNPDDPADLPVLHRTSPLHNINPDAVHPAVLVTTADHDTRVVPGHSLKYLAELQAARADNPNIFLGRVYENAGHQAESKSKAQAIEEIVDRLVFALRAMEERTGGRLRE